MFLAWPWDNIRFSIKKVILSNTIHSRIQGQSPPGDNKKFFSSSIGSSFRSWAWDSCEKNYESTLWQRLQILCGSIGFIIHRAEHSEPRQLTWLMAAMLSLVINHQHISKCVKYGICPPHCLSFKVPGPRQVHPT